MKYGEYEIDNAKVPQPVVDKLLNSAFGHIMTSEVASAIVSKIRGELTPEGGKRTDVKTDAVQAWRKAAEDGDAAKAGLIVKWESELRDAKVAAILDGSIAVKAARAPTRDPVEAALRALAKASVIATLTKNGYAFPKKDETLEVTIDGNLVELSGDDLIDRRIAHPKLGPELRKAADRKVQEEKRLREGVSKAATEGEGLASLL